LALVINLATLGYGAMHKLLHRHLAAVSLRAGKPCGNWQN